MPASADAEREVVETGEKFREVEMQRGVLNGSLRGSSAADGENRHGFIEDQRKDRPKKKPNFKSAIAGRIRAAFPRFGRHDREPPRSFLSLRCLRITRL
jgi:hypothetical protein